jgi:Cys-tRNA(Pro) deacylase
MIFLGVEKPFHRKPQEPKPQAGFANPRETIEQLIRARNLRARIIEKATTQHTLDAARALGAKPTQMIKAMVCMAIKGNEKRPFLAMVNGESRLNFEKIKAQLKAERIIMVDPITAERISGYKPGGTPPIGHKTQMPVLMDSKLVTQEILFGGGGTQETVMEITSQEIIKGTNAIIVDIS